jgi:hypothetical protein
MLPTRPIHRLESPLIAPTGLNRKLKARWETARMLAARCAGVSLDVYRVRGWDGWHRHVALALLASAFRACLPAAPAAPVAAVVTPDIDTQSNDSKEPKPPDPTPTPTPVPTESKERQGP